VQRRLRGEDLELLSREYKVTAGKLSQWRDAFNEWRPIQATTEMELGRGRSDELSHSALL